MLGWLDDKKQKDTKDLDVLQKIAIKVASVVLNGKVVHLREHQQRVVMVRGGNVAISYLQLGSQKFLSVTLQQPNRMELDSYAMVSQHKRRIKMELALKPFGRLAVLVQGAEG